MLLAPKQCRILLKWTVISLFVFLAGITGGCGNLSPQENSSSEEYNFTAWLLDVYFIFRDQLPPDLKGFNSPSELYESVNERWTEYFTPGESVQFRQFFNTNRGGIGIWFGAWHDSTSSGYRIRTVFPGSPGEMAGLRAYDTITSVNNRSVKGLSRDSFYLSAIRGNLNDVFQLTIKRGDSLLTIPVKLGNYVAPSVLVDNYDSSIAYIGLTSFLAETNTPGGSAAEFRTALQTTNWAPHTFIDLRGNGGGRLDQSVSIINSLVPVGTEIIKFHERVLDTNLLEGFTRDTIWRTDSGGEFSTREIFMLIDNNTASASEIVVSSVKDARPSVKLIGTRTYGKARAQVVVDPTPIGGIAKVTYAQLFKPNGESYDSVGLQPDIAITGNEDALQVATLLIDSTAIFKRAFKNSGRPGYLLNKEIIGSHWEPLAIRNF